MMDIKSDELLSKSSDMDEKSSDMDVLHPIRDHDTKNDQVPIRSEINNSTELILRGFLVVVSQMRSAQKEYFRSRDKTALINSKNLEKQVDDFIKDFTDKSNYNNDVNKTNP